MGKSASVLVSLMIESLGTLGLTVAPEQHLDDTSKKNDLPKLQCL